MTTNEPHPDPAAGDHGLTPDAEPQYVAEQRPPGAPLYPSFDQGAAGQSAFDQSAPDRPMPGPHGPYVEPVAYGHYPAAAYGGPYAGPAYGGTPYPGGPYPGGSYAGSPYAGGPYGGGQYPSPYAQGYGAHPGYPGYTTPQPSRKSRRNRALAGVGAAVVAAGLVLSGVAIAESRQDTGTSTAQLPADPGNGNIGNGNSGNGAGNGTGGTGVLPGGTQGNGAGNGTAASASVASKKQQIGIVTIVSVLGYQKAESAGTGMILTSDGEILTNNHVINGATSVTVTVESTGKSYRADVVGTAPTKDVAVLKLRNASNLATANVDETPDAAVGDAVIGVGNAGGTGTLRAASGKVTALEQSITATDETGSNAEKLTGLYEINAGIISGDSGGPLYDADGQVIGMDTAASAQAGSSTAQTAYAIPMDDALAVASQIESGKRTSVIHIGLPAFIGVQVLPTGTGGANIAAVTAGGPSAKAGITAGSVITAVGGTSVTSADTLKIALKKYEPGQSVTLTWTDSAGAKHQASLTLTSGPAD